MSKIYQFKIELKGIEPKIWRSVQLNDNTQLLDLHYAIQIAMGWYDSHLYQFEKQGMIYGDPEALEDGNVQDDSIAEIVDMFKAEKDTINYAYDFSDNWEHVVTLEKIIDAKEPLEHMICVGGKRNCPPEDCGGVPGYLDMLEVLKNPESDEYKELIEWIGGAFDPEFFELSIINESFKEIEEQFLLDDEEFDWDVTEKN
jgi:hypothetical protein